MPPTSTTPVAPLPTARLSLHRTEGPEGPYMTLVLRLPDGGRVAGTLSLEAFALAITGRTDTPVTLLHHERPACPLPLPVAHPAAPPR